MISSSLGIVDSARFSEVLLKARRGEDEVPIVTLMRTLFVEGWIKTLDTRGIVSLGKDRNPQFAWQASTQG
jgi:hypothetical protein